MTYKAPIRRVDTAKGHYYVDANNDRIPGVTTIISNGTPKPALINWAANATAEYAIDNWDDLAKLSPSKRLSALQKARYIEKDAAAKRGTEIHGFGEKAVQGQEVDPPEELVGHVESYIHLLDEFQLQPVLVEFTVMSYKHGYAGTADLIADFPLGLPNYPGVECPRLLIDLKSNRSGIFGETAMQLSGYRYADVYVDPKDGQEKPMLEVDGCAAVHIRADGADLIPVTAGPTEHRALLYAQQVGAFDKVSRDLVGDPVTPPSRRPRRRLQIAEGAA